MTFWELSVSLETAADVVVFAAAAAVAAGGGWIQVWHSHGQMTHVFRIRRESENEDVEIPSPGGVGRERSHTANVTRCLWCQVGGAMAWMQMTRKQLMTWENP